jgi:hypothetical protein
MLARGTLLLMFVAALDCLALPDKVLPVEERSDAERKYDQKPDR